MGTATDGGKPRRAKSWIRGNTVITAHCQRVTKLAWPLGRLRPPSSNCLVNSAHLGPIGTNTTDILMRGRAAPPLCGPSIREHVRCPRKHLGQSLACPQLENKEAATLNVKGNVSSTQPAVSQRREVISWRQKTNRLLCNFANSPPSR